MEDKEACSRCGGRCCNSNPGCAFPSDFGFPCDGARLKEAISSGKWTVDWWEGDPREGHHELDRGYFVRPAIQGREGQAAHASWGGKCTFLTETGCALSHDDRPEECRRLDPKVCHDEGSNLKQEAALAWLPFHSLLDSIVLACENAEDEPSVDKVAANLVLALANKAKLERIGKAYRGESQ